MFGKQHHKTVLQVFIIGVTFLSSVRCFGHFFPPFHTQAKQAILYDMASDMVLFEKKADERMVPSSMTKALFVYIVFEKMARGELSPHTSFHVSKRARSMQGSRMFLEKGSAIKASDLVRGIIVTSGNDACITLEEGLFPIPELAVQFMNQTAQKLGLQQSFFVNTTGWPDARHYSTARDILTVGIRTIRDFPGYYAEYYGQKSLKHNKITQYNRNPLVHRDMGDGLKTGLTEKGGYGLLGSAKQKGRRLVFVVNGLKSETTRALASFSLLKWGFEHFRIKRLFSACDVVGQIHISQARQYAIPVTTNKDINVTYPKGFEKEIKTKIETHDVQAPLKKGTQVASLVIYSPGLTPARTPLFCQHDVREISFFQKTLQAIKTFLLSWFKV